MIKLQGRERYRFQLDHYQLTLVFTQIYIETALAYRVEYSRKPDNKTAKHNNTMGIDLSSHQLAHLHYIQTFPPLQKLVQLQILRKVVILLSNRRSEIGIRVSELLLVLWSPILPLKVLKDKSDVLWKGLVPQFGLNPDESEHTPE